MLPPDDGVRAFDSLVFHIPSLYELRPWVAAFFSFAVYSVATNSAG